MAHPYGFDQLSPGDLDLLIRGVYGEAGEEGTLGQQGVAAVIGNRLRSGKYGRTIGDVLLSPGQFEAMTRASDKVNALQPGSLPYLQIKQAILSMQGDPTRGAVRFYSPSAQAASGRDAPMWSKGQLGLEIGRHRFYGGDYRPEEVGSDAQGALPAYNQVPNTPLSSPVLEGTGVTSFPLSTTSYAPATVPGPLPPQRPGVPGAAPTGNPNLDAALSKVSPELRENFMRALAAAPPDIRTAISINSGLRTIDRQRQLWEASDKTGRMVARPGHSQHERGNALDLGYATPAAKTWMHQNAKQFGLNFPMSYEDWHIEPAGVRGPPKVLPPEAGGPPAGQPTPSPRVGELAPAAPAASPIPNVIPIRAAPSIAETMISALGSDSGGALAGLGGSLGGGGRGGGGGVEVGPSIQGAGYDEELGRQAAAPFRNRPQMEDGIGKPTQINPKLFDLPSDIGAPSKGLGGLGKNPTAMRKLMAALQGL